MMMMMVMMMMIIINYYYYYYSPAWDTPNLGVRTVRTKVSWWGQISWAIQPFHRHPQMHQSLALPVKTHFCGQHLRPNQCIKFWGNGGGPAMLVGDGKRFIQISTKPCVEIRGRCRSWDSGGQCPGLIPRPLHCNWQFLSIFALFFLSFLVAWPSPLHVKRDQTHNPRLGASCGCVKSTKTSLYHRRGLMVIFCFVPWLCSALSIWNKDSKNMPEINPSLWVYTFLHLDSIPLFLMLCGFMFIN